ncbi:hypothetical protein AK812_SmicGene46595, partial [Symbiodinium microadriaticum]
AILGAGFQGDLPVIENRLHLGNSLAVGAGYWILDLDLTAASADHMGGYKPGCMRLDLDFTACLLIWEFEVLPAVILAGAFAIAVHVVLLATGQTTMTAALRMEQQVLLEDFMNGWITQEPDFLLKVRKTKAVLVTLAKRYAILSPKIRMLKELIVMYLGSGGQDPDDAILAE